MSLKFAAIGNLMVLVVLEERSGHKDRSRVLWPTETYDPLLAVIGRARRGAETMTIEPASTERPAHEARW